MEGKKKSDGNSSFACDLFGAKVDSSSRHFQSIFPLPPNPKASEHETKKKNETPPFHYSSSIYYGGQDLYSDSSYPNTTTPPNPYLTPNSAEDDKDIASRGNWWQGSLYY